MDSPATYWDFLSAGGDGLVGIPGDRWQVDKFYAPGAPVPGLSRVRRGVFVGGFTLDYGQLQFSGAGKARTNLGAHTATGIVMTMFANRISHAFDLWARA